MEKVKEKYYVDLSNQFMEETGKKVTSEESKEFYLWLETKQEQVEVYFSHLDYLGALDKSKIIIELGKGIHDTLGYTLSKQGYNFVSISEYADTFERRGRGFEIYNGKLTFHQGKPRIAYANICDMLMGPRIDSKYQEPSIVITQLPYPNSIKTLTSLPISDVDVVIGWYGDKADKNIYNRLENMGMIRERLAQLEKWYPIEIMEDDKQIKDTIVQVTRVRTAK